MSLSIETLYEDNDCVVFGKPPRLLVIPSPKEQNRTLSTLVNQGRADALNRRLFPCHRLDRDTSGAILYAKGKRNQAFFMGQFKKHQVRKKYIAFVRGKVARDKGRIDYPVADRHTRRFGERARVKSALTEYRVLERRAGYTVVEVVPHTGRTNQIRIHFSNIGHPLLGERVYARGKDFEVKFRRVALHASELSFHRAVNSRIMRIKCPLAADMMNFLNDTKGQRKETS